MNHSHLPGKRVLHLIVLLLNVVLLQLNWLTLGLQNLIHELAILVSLEGNQLLLHH